MRACEVRGILVEWLKVEVSKIFWSLEFKIFEFYLKIYLFFIFFKFITV